MDVVRQLIANENDLMLSIQFLNINISERFKMNFFNIIQTLKSPCSCPSTHAMHKHPALKPHSLISIETFCKLVVKD